MNIRSLNEKWHGLPKWAWAAIVAGGMFLLYYFYKKRSAGKATATNATPDDAGNASDLTNPFPDSGGGGGGGFLPPNAPAGEVQPLVGSTIGNLVPSVIAPEAPPTVPPVIGQTASPTKVAATAAKSVLVPAKATATSLQSTVEKVGPSAVFVPNTKAQAAALSHPSAVKITANKTGGSANKTQGVFAIH